MFLAKSCCAVNHFRRQLPQRVQVSDQAPLAIAHLILLRNERLVVMHLYRPMALEMLLQDGRSNQSSYLGHLNLQPQMLRYRQLRQR